MTDKNRSSTAVRAATRLPGAPGRAGWVAWPVRLGASLATLLLFNQTVFAGQFLSGTFASLQTHRDNATYAGVTVLITAACAVLIRRPGGGPIWPALAFLGLFALIALQIALGFARTLTLHVPLGVLIIALSARLTLWSWSHHPGPAPTPTDPPVPAAASPPAERPVSESVITPGQPLSAISPPSPLSDRSVTESVTAPGQPLSAISRPPSTADLPNDR